MRGDRGFDTLEYRVPCLVDRGGVAADAVGVCEVTGHGVESNRLGRDPGAGDVKYIERGHVDPLLTSALTAR